MPGKPKLEQAVQAVWDGRNQVKRFRKYAGESGAFLMTVLAVRTWNSFEHGFGPALAASGN
jgi:hypothetical protein